MLHTQNCTTQESYMDLFIKASGKMIFLQKFLQKMREENKKVLIFSQFVNMLKLLEEYLKC